MAAMGPVVMAAGAGASHPKDLLIVGPGVLGGYAGKLWKDANPGASVFGQTNTTNNHERWVGSRRDWLGRGQGRTRRGMVPAMKALVLFAAALGTCACHPG